MGDVYMLNGKILSGLPNHAKDIEFDNTGTTLNSTNTEDAIKEVNSNLMGYTDVSNLFGQVSPSIRVLRRNAWKQGKHVHAELFLVCDSLTSGDEPILQINANVAPDKSGTLKEFGLYIQGDDISACGIGGQYSSTYSKYLVYERITNDIPANTYMSAILDYMIQD